MDRTGLVVLTVIGSILTGTINLFEDIDGIVSDDCEKCNSMYDETNYDLDKIHRHQGEEHTDEELIKATKELIFKMNNKEFCIQYPEYKKFCELIDICDQA